MEGKTMEHRRIRLITHDICDQYYSQVKDMRNWEEVNALSQEYHERYGGDPLADDLLRAYTQEWWRCYGEEAVLDGKESPQ